MDCKNWQKKYSNNLLHNYALYHYNSTFHDLMVDYKRRGDYALREVLQELCYEYLHKTKYDYYVPIPTSLNILRNDSLILYLLYMAIFCRLHPF